ncbi:MAG: hypothetical protein CVV52_07480 [Spirochaetae bacterium HGW-Spirochaetae-8]|nr:MAG: hypothetical protein CVV52_07480 [Spirochaetae bacterium HGW-Spirochaetae-8]
MQQTPMRKSGQRLGFVLASTHTGSSNGLWASIADAAVEAGSALYVFPGGRLNSLSEFEHLRNSVFKLANSKNLDGLISWGSSLCGTESVENVSRFHSIFQPLPLVTIAMKIPGSPNIGFDAYLGMKALVHHCIHVHQAQRIAFIRGPVNHASAQERYQAYLDGLQECGIALDEQLAAPPSPWNEGEGALRQLCENRQLLPGRDFDTLLCASDMLMFTAAKLLQKWGYRIPEDIRIAGFNDSPESRFLSAAGTTVRVPFADMGRSAFDMLRQLVKGRTVPDKLEPATLIVRNSCGCGYRKEILSGGQKPLDREELCSWAIERFSLDAQHVQAWLEPLVGALYQGIEDHTQELFSSLLFRVLQRYFERDTDATAFQDTMARLEQLSDLPTQYRQEMVDLCWSMAVDAQARIGNIRTYENLRRSNILNSFKCDLLRAWNRNAIPRILHTHLPLLGIQQAFLVMAENEGYSRYVGGYTEAGMTEGENELFPSLNLLPDEIATVCRAGVYLVQPLFIENQVLGHLVTMISDRDGSLHEELRSSISSALKGVLLFEETVHAKEVAEKAEIAKMRFFSTMGDGLKEPLAVILDKMNQLDGMIRDQGDLSRPLGRAIEAVRDEMELQLEKTSLLFDYTLAQAGELELESKLFAFAPILASITSRWQFTSVVPPRLPLLQGDEGRILQMMELVSAYTHRKYPGKTVLTVQVEPEGIRCRLTSPASLKADAEGNQRLLLAHNIVLLHQGMFLIAEHEIELFLPLPNLGGLAPMHGRSTPRRLLLITSDAGTVPIEAKNLAQRFRLELSPVITERLLKDQADVADGTVIFWDADVAGFDQFLAMKLLLQHGRLFRVPVVCYGQDLTGPTLGEAVTVRIRTKHAGPIVFWGPSISDFPLLCDIEGRFAVDSYDRFRRLLEECKPSVVLLDTVDQDRIAFIRNQAKLSLVPIVLLVDRLPAEEAMGVLCAIPQVVVCHASVAAGPEFSMRLRDIAGGGDVLPSHTGALVKRSLWYLEHHAASQVSRWKLADSVNVSEDYLTRVFHKELGMSPWEYLNRYRIQLACDLLVRTNLSLSEISGRTGFQDQAYFCRVFKKLKGCTPSALRNA